VDRVKSPPTISDLIWTSVAIPVRVSAIVLNRGGSVSGSCIGRRRRKSLLPADVAKFAAGFSSVPSAFRPKVKFTAENCADGGVQRCQNKSPELNRLETFEFQHSFACRSHDFVASQGYFLKP